jgi:hypothetical protein
VKEERRALAAIIASGIVTYRRPYLDVGYDMVAKEALAIADAIIKKSDSTPGPR